MKARTYYVTDRATGKPLGEVIAYDYPHACEVAVIQGYQGTGTMRPSLAIRPGPVTTEKPTND